MPNEVNGITLNSITMSRLAIFAERAKARGEEASLESHVEALMDFAITEMQRRWKAGDVYKNRKNFINDIAKLGAIGADGGVKDGALFMKLANKYGINQGQQKQV